MELQIGVKVLLENKEGKFLFLRRSQKKYPSAAGIWDIPGGRIDPGIPLLENLQREIREETGLQLDSSFDLIAAQDILRVEGKHIVRLTYRGSCNEDPFLSEEHEAYQWFTREELDQLSPEILDVYVTELLHKKTIP